MPAVTPDTPAAIVLLSGGLDSATALAVARDAGFACRCLSFDYGQKHRFELDAAARVATRLGAIEHRVVRLDPAGFAGSALTSGELAVPRDRDESQMAADIPVTYVPARNLVMLATAVSFAESTGACDIYMGVNAVDYSGYPDCRPQFIEAFQHAANLGTRVGVQTDPPGEPTSPAIRIRTPLIDLTKAQIITLGRSLGVDYALTHSCYDPALDGRACGRCDACRLRAKGFADAGLPDPTRYADAPAT